MVGGEAVGGASAIRGVAPLESAGPDELSFVANARYLPYVQATSAAAVLVAVAGGAVVPRRARRRW